jgi:hypothetical protein
VTQSLEQKISAALADAAITPTQLEALADELDVGIAEAERIASKLHEDVHDPQLYPDRRETKQHLDDAEFAVGRLLTLRPRLERHLAQLIAAEQHARWLANYIQIEAKRDAAAEQFKQYPELVNQLLDLLHTARQLDADCDRVNSTAPSGEPRRLLGVVLTARNLKTFSLANPSIADRIRLPNSVGDLMLWPPPTNAAALVAPHPTDPRFSADWGLIKEHQEQQARDQAECDQEQRDQSAIEAQRSSGAPVWWRP